MSIFILLTGLAAGYVIGKRATTWRMNKELESLMVTVRRVIARPAV